MPQQDPCVIVCQLCGCSQTVNFRRQKEIYCSGCQKKLQKVGLKVQRELDKQKAEAKAKVAKKPKVAHIHCDKCGKSFICPSCSPPEKTVKSKSAPKKAKPKPAPKKTTKPKKSKVQKGGKNARS